MPASAVPVLSAGQRPANQPATRCAPRSVRPAHLAGRPLAPAAPPHRPPLTSCRRLQALPGISENLDGETRSELPGFLTLTTYAAHELAKRSQLG